VAQELKEGAEVRLMEVADELVNALRIAERDRAFDVQNEFRAKRLRPAVAEVLGGGRRIFMIERHRRSRAILWSRS